MFLFCLDFFVISTFSCLTVTLIHFELYSFELISLSTTHLETINIVEIRRVRRHFYRSVDSNCYDYCVCVCIKKKILLKYFFLRNTRNVLDWEKHYQPNWIGKESEQLGQNKDPNSHFYKHFTSSFFCLFSFAKIIQTQTVSAKKLHIPLSYE